jgi:hypothetical protein
LEIKMKRTAIATLAALALLALGTTAKADSVLVQSEFNGFFEIDFPLPGTLSGLLVFPGPYELAFRTVASSQKNTFLDGSLVVTETTYGPGGRVDVLGPNGFELTGIFTDAVLGQFTNTAPIPGFPVGSVIGFSFAGAFTGSLADGEPWKGTSGAEENLCCNEPSPMFLQMSGPVSAPEPGTLVLLVAGIFGLAFCRRPSPQVVEENGRPVRARTADLYRVKGQLTNTYNNLDRARWHVNTPKYA